MQYDLPNRQYVFENFISLSEAFQIVGAAMFPESWTGLETLAWPKEPPTDLRDEMDRLDRNVTKARTLERDLTLLSAGGDGDPDLAAKIEDARTARQAAEEARNAFGEGYDFRMVDAEAYRRRAAVEEELCRGIRARSLTLFRMGGTGSAIQDGWGVDRTTISFAFSLVIYPEFHGKRRRYPAVFQRSEFENWAKKHLDVLAQFDTASLQEQMISWFKTERAKWHQDGERRTKSDLNKACRTEFDGVELGENFDLDFDAIWRLYAPSEWKKGGRSKGS